MGGKNDGTSYTKQNVVRNSHVQMKKAWSVSHIIFAEEPLQLLILYVPQCEKNLK